jgi:hypothetical protein
MLDLYWLTRLGALHNISVLIIFAVSVLLIIGAVIYFAHTDDCDETELLALLRYGRLLLTVIGITSLVYIVTPTTKDAMLIYGVGGTIDYIKNDDKCKQLPGKVIDALDKYMDYLNKED